LPVALFLQDTFVGDPSLQLPKKMHVSTSMFENGVEKFEIVTNGDTKRQKCKLESARAFTDFKESLPAADQKRLFALPPKKDNKDSFSDNERRLKIMREWMDQLFKQASKSKLSPEALARIISFVHSAEHEQASAATAKDKKTSDKLELAVHKLEAKQETVTVKFKAALKKYHDLCEFNDKQRAREMPPDREEIPEESGNVYINLEPTDSLRPLRKKCIALNKEAMKVTDQRNKAISAAKNGSASIKEMHDLDDARSDSKCMICHAVFLDHAKLRLTPCGHAMHEKCLDPWLLAGKCRCPSCNLTLLMTSKDD
jgi:hypothetical protein